MAPLAEVRAPLARPDTLGRGRAARLGPAVPVKVRGDYFEVLGDQAEGRTVLSVVDDQPLLVGSVAALLPPPSPNDALQARRFWVRPREAKVPGNLLEPVGMDREVDVGADQRQHVHGVGQQSVHWP